MTAHYEDASPTLLASQPAVGQPVPPKPHWAEIKGHLETRLASLRNWRQSWWSQNWSDLAEFINPKRSIWLTQSAGGNPSPNNMTRGRPINNSIVDPTATLAVRVCASGLMSGLASPSRPWFKIMPMLRKFELDSSAREWIDESENRMYTVLAASNFYNSFAQECEDLVVFGTAPSVIYEDKQDLIRFYNPAVGEYYLSTDSSGKIDGLYRLFVMTVSQIVSFFGINHCPKIIQDKWKEKGNNLEFEFQIAHAIEPNFSLNAENAGKLPEYFTWREIYWLWASDAEAPLAMNGYVDQPFTAARWTTQSNDAYGRSPGMDVLPDVMQLQVMTRRMAEAIEKQVRPPLIGEMSLKNKPTSTLPGHLTYVTEIGPGKGIRPIYEVNPDVSALSANIQAIEQRIQMGLFNDLFLMLEQNPTDRATAYEISQKVQEKLQVLGPVIEGVITESLKPKLKRVYNILRRKGIFTALPGSLQGVPLDIEFVSMLALAQKGAATAGIERLLALVGGLAAIAPDAMDNINVDVTVREYNDLLGNPQKILYGPDELAQSRAQKQQMMQQQQQMAAVQQAAEAAGKAAPAAQVLQNTSVGGGQNALASILGQLGGGGDSTGGI